MLADHLAGPRISIVSRGPDAELSKITQTVRHVLEAGDRAELEALLGSLLTVEAPVRPRTLDLIGHTTQGDGLLALGEFVIDASSPTVAAFFRGLQDDDVLGRLGIQSVRLLGCSTAASVRARWTVCRLSQILDVEVLGSVAALFPSYYDHDGFADERRYLLASSRDLAATAFDPTLLDGHDARTRVLNIDGIPARALEPRAWPIRIADRDDARAILRIVACHNGSIAPTLEATPSFEIAFPAAAPGRYHMLQALFGGDIIRVEHDGGPSILYPVERPDELRRLADQLPAQGPASTQRNPSAK